MGVHVANTTDPAPQIKYIAETIRAQYRKGPLILVGTFNAPQQATTRPSDTALAELLVDTGLKDAFGVLSPEAPLPLQPTHLLSGLHVDYIFYRGLDLVG